MRDEDDTLEAELSALRPHSVSPELRQRIAERLAEKGDWLRSDDLKFQKRSLAARCLSDFCNRRMALAGSLAAACLLAVLLRWGGNGEVELKTVVVRTQPAPRVEDGDGQEAEINDSVPMLLAYQRALARSPEDLEALLNKHALVTPETNPALVRIRAFTRSAAELRALLGDD